MKRNLKVLGTLIAAVFAMSALASAAQAETMFNSSVDNTAISGTQDNTHHFSNGTFDVTCSSASFSGTQSGTTTTEVTITPKYTGCHVIILFTFSATVNFNSCDYVFKSDGTVGVKCDEANDAIVISAAGCTIEIGPQSIGGAASYENSEGDIVVTANAEGIEYSQSGGTCGSKEGSNGTYTGIATVSGEDADEGGPASISWSEE